MGCGKKSSVETGRDILMLWFMTSYTLTAALSKQAKQTVKRRKREVSYLENVLSNSPQHKAMLYWFIKAKHWMHWDRQRESGQQPGQHDVGIGSHACNNYCIYTIIGWNQQTETLLWWDPHLDPVEIRISNMLPSHVQTCGLVKRTWTRCWIPTGDILFLWHWAWPLASYDGGRVKRSKDYHKNNIN